MTEEIEVSNAVIEGARFDTERGCLSAWLQLDYGSTQQGFGGYLLYAPDSWNAHKHPGNVAGHFIWRCLQIAAVDDWSKLKGRTIRVKRTWSKVIAIGHIVKDMWFDPSVEFEAMRTMAGVSND